MVVKHLWIPCGSIVCMLSYVRMFVHHLECDEYLDFNHCLVVVRLLSFIDCCAGKLLLFSCLGLVSKVTGFDRIWVNLLVRICEPIEYYMTGPMIIDL